MHEILISTSVFIGCLLITFMSRSRQSSQTDLDISRNNQETSTYSGTSKNLQIDPEDSNPALFTMAPSNLININVNATNNKTIKQEIASFSSDNLSVNKQQDKKKKESKEIRNRIIASKPLEKITNTGLKITDLIIGTGNDAGIGDTVSVKYCGKMEDGTKFDERYTSDPFIFTIGTGQIIKGWEEGILGMKVGGRRILVIPPALGYGDRGAGFSIPPNATLVYEIDLLDVNC
uniref:peptidylprolyl isomerase n=1 Tax=Paulinella chromatophora TaxID=39717 RepID=B1X3S2_PAUCH|nr:FKBP-type peptidyl-prolyl cis-trans isomerase (PPIase) [Paulinella chromatophora]ACB42591.1 FKBP-type peptidyl-prolyl cis-trans isomerase (PPIase) [Paulinella chromatophora]